MENHLFSPKNPRILTIEGRRKALYSFHEESCTQKCWQFKETSHPICSPLDSFYGRLLTFALYATLLFRYCPRLLSFLFFWGGSPKIVCTIVGGLAKIVLIRTRGEGGQKTQFLPVRTIWMFPNTPT